MTELTQILLRELFEYVDGNLYRKTSPSRNVKIGDLAGCVNNHGYREIRISYKPYKAHRLIFLYHHGYLPKYLDHIDGNRSNNDISNIREATKNQNGMNQKKQISHNGKPLSSIYKGVDWYKRYKKWRARIEISRKSKLLGYFTSERAAAQAYNCAAINHFGEFAKLNDI